MILNRCVQNVYFLNTSLNLPKSFLHQFICNGHEKLHIKMKKQFHHKIIRIYYCIIHHNNKIVTLIIHNTINCYRNLYTFTNIHTHREISRRERFNNQQTYTNISLSEHNFLFKKIFWHGKYFVHLCSKKIHLYQTRII